MQLIFMGIDKPSGNAIFHYPCRKHQISFKRDDDFNAELEGVQIEDIVELNVSVLDVRDAFGKDREVKATQVWEVHVPTKGEIFWNRAVPAFVEGFVYLTSGYGIFHLIKLAFFS